MSAVEVAVALPVTGTFSYRVPDRLTGQIDIGSQVVVPFGRRRVAGLVMALDASEGASPRPTGRARVEAEIVARPGALRAAVAARARALRRRLRRTHRRVVRTLPPPGTTRGPPSRRRDQAQRKALAGRRGAPRADLDVGGADQEHCSRGSSRSRATRAALLAADRHARALWSRVASSSARSDRARRQARRRGSTSQPARRLRSRRISPPRSPRSPPRSTRAFRPFRCTA